jgi:hypothetical protein
MSQNFIQPATQTETTIITSFIVTVTNVQLFTSANLTVQLCNAEPRLVTTVYLVLAGDDYNNWANNDEYIISYVATTLGFVLAPPAPPTISVPIEPTAPLINYD